MGRRIWSLVLVGVVVAISGCATVDPWQDARIESEVKARLVAEKDANLTRLGVVSRQSVVYLTGEVVSGGQRGGAGGGGGARRGVRGVVNPVEVRAPRSGPSTGSPQCGPALGQEDEWARGPTGLEVTVRVRGGGERITMAHVDAEHTLVQRGEDAAGNLDENGALSGVVEEHGVAQRRRLGGEPL